MTSSAHEDSSSSDDDDDEEPILNEATLEKQRVATQAILATSHAITAADPQTNGNLGDNNSGGLDGAGEELKKDGEEEDGNIVIVCGLRIDIEKITDQEMYALRKVLPRKEYR